MAYNTAKRKIAKIIYSSRTNSLKIIGQTSNDKRIDDNFELLKPSQTAINYVRNKTQDWSRMESYTSDDAEFNTQTQYKNWVIDFGNFDIRIIPSISYRPIYRQEYGGDDDGATFSYPTTIQQIWTVAQDTEEENKTNNVQLHFGINLSMDNKVQTIYEVKLLVDISNPNIYI